MVQLFAQSLFHILTQLVMVAPAMIFAVILTTMLLKKFATRAAQRTVMATANARSRNPSTARNQSRRTY